MPLFGDKLQRGVEVLRRLLGVLHVIQRVAAIDVGFHHLGIALNGARVVIDGLIQKLRVLVNVSFDQREVGSLGRIESYLSATASASS